MSAYAQMLLEKRANTWEQAKALLDTAANEKRELTAEERQSYDKMNEDLKEMRSLADQLMADEKSASDAEASLRSLAEVKPSGPVNPAAALENDASTALRAFLKGETRDFEAKGTPAEVRAINEARALGPGSSSAGGALIPTNFYNKLWAHLINASQFLQSGITVLQTDTGANLTLPTTTAHSTAAWGNAGAAIAESDPAFVDRTLSAYKASLLIQVDQELVDDESVDLEGYLAMQAGRAVGNLVGTAMVTGSGSSQPTGITTLTTLGVTGGTGVAGKPTFDDVINLYYSVIPQYRSAESAGWVLNDVTAGYLRTLKDTYGQYLWQPGLTLGTPDTILGKRVVTEVGMATTALNAKSILFGDLSAYFARVVNGIRFEQSRDYAFGNDQITFRCIMRADGTLIDQTGAVKHFVGGAS